MVGAEILVKSVFGCLVCNRETAALVIITSVGSPYALTSLPALVTDFNKGRSKTPNGLKFCRWRLGLDFERCRSIPRVFFLRQWRVWEIVWRSLLQLQPKPPNEPPVTRTLLPFISLAKKVATSSAVVASPNWCDISKTDITCLVELFDTCIKACFCPKKYDLFRQVL